MDLAPQAAPRRFWAGLLLGFASLFAAKAALAERPLTRALQVEESDCFQHEALSREIAKWLGRSSLDDRLAIVVVPGPEPSLGRVSFSILRDGQVVVDRELQKVDAPCPELRSAVALAIAIAIESTLVEAREQAAAARPAPRARRPPAAPAPAPAPRLRAPALGAFAGAFVGLVPRPTWGAGLDVSVPLWRPVDVRAALFVSGPQSLSLGTGNADLQLWAGSIDGCFVRDPGALRFRACAGAALGRLTADGHDYSESRTPRLMWASASARLDLRLKLASRWGASIGAEGWVPLARPTLDVRSETGQILSETRLPAAGASAGVGLEVEIW